MGSDKKGTTGEYGDLTYGTVDDGDTTHDVYFKTNDRGHTLIADSWTDGECFDTDKETGFGAHDHYGDGDGPNENGTRRGWYTGPGN